MSSVQVGAGGRSAASFGAGALAAAVMVVTVYEGGVRVVGAHDRAELALGPGETSIVDRDGEVARITTADADAAEERPSAASAQLLAAGRTRGAAVTGASDPAALASEVARLQAILARHSISPQTGERTRVGIESDGNTDLTPDEWRILAERGELRYRLPGREDDAIRPDMIEARGLDPDTARRLDRIVADAHRALHADIAALYAESTGLDPSGLSLQGMLSEIEDKTPLDETLHVRWVLAQERAGRMVPPPISPEMTPYERMMRRLVSFERELEQALAAEVGPDQAHALLFGQPAMNAVSFGTRGQPRR